MIPIAHPSPPFIEAILYPITTHLDLSTIHRTLQLDMLQSLSLLHSIHSMSYKIESTRRRASEGGWMGIAVLEVSFASI